MEVCSGGHWKDSLQSSISMKKEEKSLIIQLIEAYANNDAQLFYQLCDTREKEIFQEFDNWTIAPEWVRQKEELISLYAHTINTVADYFANKGNPTLMEKLVGDASSNPMIQIENELMTAQNLFNHGEYEQSNQILLSHLKLLEGSKGSGVAQLYPKIVGLAANNYLKLGNVDMAKMFAETAITKCMEIGDKEGETIYRKNLKLIVAYKAYTENSDHIICKTRSDIVTAQKLSDKGSYKKSNQLLNELLNSIEQTTDFFLKEYLAKVYGLIGTNFYYLKNAAEAKNYTSKALEHADLNRDRPGILIYSENLKVLERK